jgi:two-component system aerobic respiration control sensor histidine kinase ArcB
MNILLVEDEPVALTANRMMIEALGYTLDTAVNGKQALALSAAKPYDLIFMDIGLPDINGIEVTTKIRRQEKNLHRHKHAHIVALTTHSIDEIKEKSLTAGMNKVASKPISFAALGSLIDNALLPT